MIYKEKLEELLVRNWTKFLDTKKVLVKVLQDANASADTFNIVKSDGKPEKKAMQVSLSRFRLADTGFLIWVEFVVPRDGEVYVGTAEYRLLASGSLELRQMLGTRFKKDSE